MVNAVITRSSDCRKEVNAQVKGQWVVFDDRAYYSRGESLNLIAGGRLNRPGAAGAKTDCPVRVDSWDFRIPPNVRDAVSLITEPNSLLQRQPGFRNVQQRILFVRIRAMRISPLPVGSTNSISTPEPTPGR